MAKKFVKVFGLHSIFNVKGNILDITSIKLDVSNRVDGDSIVFITADLNDIQYGYPNDSKYIWTHNEIYSTNDASFIVNSGSDLYLDISVNGYTIAYGVKILEVSTATNASNGLVSAYDVKLYIDNVNKDEKQKIEASAGKIYLTGTSTTSTTSIGYANASVYATNGVLHADRLEIGVGATASGENSVAIGLNVIASGVASYVEGYLSTVSGTFSHAEGSLHVVTGKNAHAEGASNIVKGQNAHAEGAANMANGGNSHAEGNCTQAGGGLSHTEGVDTFGGYLSHAEGNAVQSVGEGAHGEGYYTYAGGKGSHAEGVGALYDVFTDGTTYKTFTMIPSSVVITEGALYSTMTFRCSSVPSGITITPEILSKTTIFYFGSSNYGSTYVLPANANPQSTYNAETLEFTIYSTNYFTIRDFFTTGELNRVRLTYISQLAKGIGSHVEGQHTTAAGTASHAEGQHTVAQNTGEHAEGVFNQSHTGVTNAEKTIHSVGVGTANTARKNVVEIMQDASVYIKDIGGYDGSNYLNASSLQEVLNNKQDAGNYATVQTGNTLGTISGKLIVKDGTSNDNQIKTLDNGSNGQVLAMTNGSPAWSTITGGAGTDNGTIQLKVGNVSTGNIAVKGLNNAAYKNVDTTVTTTSRNLPDSSAVAAYVTNQISSKLEAVLVYKGPVNSSTLLTSDASVGWTYVANATFSYTSAQAAPGTSAEPGDMFIRNSSTLPPYYDVIQTNIDPTKYAVKGHTHTVTVSGTTAEVSIQPKGSVTTTVTGKTTTFSGSYKPTGSVTTTVTGKTTTFSGSYTPKGSVTTTVTGKTTTFSGSYTPSGSVTVGTFGFTNTNATVTHNLSISNYAHTHSFTGTTTTITMSYLKSNTTTKDATASITGSITASYTPEGTISASLTTTSGIAEITLSFASHSHSFNGSSTTFTGSYTPSGTISKPTISATLSSTSITYGTGGRTLTTSSVSITSTGSVDSSVFTTYSYTTASETLRLILGKPNVTVTGTSSSKYVTNVTLTTSSFNNPTAVNAVLSTTPVFYGTAATISVSGKPLGTIGAKSGNVTGTVTYTKATGVSATFNGTAGKPTVTWSLSVSAHNHGITLSATNISASYQPSGSIGARNASATPSISGSITVSYDKLSSAKGSFSGTASNISVSGTPLLNGPTSTFTGTNATISVSGTPLLNTPTSTFTGTDATISVSGTPLLNTPTSTFTGTTFTHSHSATLSGTSSTESPQS